MSEPGKTPNDYLSLTPGDLKRVVAMQEILGSILNNPNPQTVLSRLQKVEDTCRQISREAFWRAF